MERLHHGVTPLPEMVAVTRNPPVCWRGWLWSWCSSLLSHSSWDLWILSFRPTMSQLESSDC